MNELALKILALMEEHGLKVYDLELIEELLEKTVVRDQKECSY
jgi:hypothetical protein